MTDGNELYKNISLYEVACHDVRGYHVCRQWFTPITLKKIPYPINVVTLDYTAHLVGESVIDLQLEC